MDKKVKLHLLAIHQQESCILSNEYDTAQIHCEHKGNLLLPTGEITFADPMDSYNSLNDLSRKTFSEKVDPGIYPVYAYISSAADRDRIGFAEIRFSDKEPVTFTPAKTQFDAQYDHKGRFGYPVGSSRTGYMDTSVYRKLAGSTINKDLIFLDYDRSTPEMLNAELTLCAFCYTEDKSENAVHFTVPSGRYYWYWGIAKDKTKCCLIGDFFTYI